MSGSYDRAAHLQLQQQIRDLEHPDTRIEIGKQGAGAYVRVWYGGLNITHPAIEILRGEGGATGTPGGTHCQDPLPPF